MPAKSKSQQRFFGMVRAAQKGDLKDPSSEVADVADDISVKDAKKFAKTKHKGLPEKKAVKEGTSVINVNTSPKKVSYRGATKKSPHWTKFKPDEKTREHTKDLIQGKKPKKPKGKLRQKGDTWRASNYHVNFKHYKPDSKKKEVKEELTGDMKTDLEKYRVPRGPGGNPIRMGDKVRSMKSSQPLGQLKVKYGADKVREYYKKNKAVGEEVQIEEKKGRHPRDQKELDRAQAYIKKNPNFGKKEVNEEASYKDFVKKAQDASSRVKKAKQAQKDANAKAAYKDRVTKGVRFYDKKGSGHIRDGKKVYS